MKKWSGFLAVVLGISFLGNLLVVYADDHDDDDYDDDDDYYYYQETPETNADLAYWYLWSRDISSLKGVLPFTEPKNITLQNANSNQSLHLYAIPKLGEIFVAGKSVSTYLGANATFYSTSRILEVNKDEIELVFRAGTNVVYENLIKTPLPAEAMYLNGDVYLPISVIANGLGYSVEWDATEETFYLLEMVHY